MVRNGHAPQREVLCGAGSLEVKAPRVNDHRVDEAGERRSCSLSALASALSARSLASRLPSASLMAMPVEIAVHTASTMLVTSILFLP